MVSYDKGFGPYLEAMGIPSFIVSLIKGAAEKLHVTPPAEPGGEWHMKSVSDLMTRDWKFRIGEEFSVVWGKGRGVLFSVCSMPKTNVIHCKSEDRARGWEMEGILTFSPLGMVSERIHITKGVKMKKYYERMNKLQLQEEERKYVCSKRRSYIAVFNILFSTKD